MFRNSMEPENLAEYIAVAEALVLGGADIGAENNKQVVALDYCPSEYKYARRFLV